MKTSIKLCGLAAAVLMATAGSAMASDTVVPYVLDSQSKVVTNSTGLCWRTSFWTPALAEQGGPDGLGCTCDKDILSAAACTKAAPVEEPRVAKVTLAADTLFAFDSAKLSEDGRNMLDQLVSRMAGMDVEVQPPVPSVYAVLLLGRCQTGSAFRSALRRLGVCCEGHGCGRKQRRQYVFVCHVYCPFRIFTLPFQFPHNKVHC